MDDGIVFFQIWDSKGRVIARYGEENKLPFNFQLKVVENFREGGLQNVYRKNADGAVQLVIQEESHMFQGAAARTRACSIYLSLIPKLKQIEQSQRQHFDAIIQRFAHNLIKLQARFKANFSRLISDAARGRPYSELKEEVGRRIEGNLDSAADDVLQMAHRTVDLDAQIETLRIISGFAEESAPSDPIRVDLQKAMFRITHPFFKEFRDKDVNINVNIQSATSGSEKVQVIPQFFSAAMWQLFDNASKYVKSGTTIEITASLNTRPQKMEIAMTSVCIDEDETELIFLEGKTGRHSGKKSGSGIGMFIVRKALGLMGARISVKNESEVGVFDKFKYCKHRFTIEFSP